MSSGLKGPLKAGKSRATKNNLLAVFRAGPWRQDSLTWKDGVIFNKARKMKDSCNVLIPSSSL